MQQLFREKSMADIATKKIFENDKFAAWEMVLEPGQSSGLHTHSHSYVFYVLEGATCEVIDKEGKSCGALTMEPGFTMFFNLENQELVAGDFRIPLTHSARNIGTTRFREILVESK
jgi:oxalate decarboxylase/phosphoglucose isomerase-like protein (cupin superfamily)